MFSDHASRALEKETDISITLRLVLTGLSVLLVWLAYPGKEGEGFSFLAWVCLVPWGFALTGASPRTGLLCGFLYGFFAFFGITPGVVTGLINIEITSIHGSWILFGILCAIQALPYALFGTLQGIFGWLGKPWGVPRSAACLTLLLILVPQIFPGSHAHALYNSPLMIQILDLGGVPLLLFIVNLANIYFLGVVAGLVRRQKPFVPAVAFILLLAVIAVYGKFRLNEYHHEISEAEPSIHVVSIQPNIPLFDFMGDESIRLQPIMQLSQQAMKKFPDGGLFVLPEIPYNPDCDDELYRDHLPALAKKSGKEFLVQCDKTLGKVWPQYFNSVKIISPVSDSDQRYDKMILFPFGEYVPGSAKFPFLNQMVPDFGRSYSPGREFTVFDLGKNIKAAPSLCYETVFSNHIREFIQRGANMIINMTDDAWWGESDLPMVHFALASFRAVEYRVPMARVTNAGVGAFVEATGEIVPGSLTPLFEETLSSFPLFVPETRSPYFYLGDVFLWGLLAFFVVDILRNRFRLPG